MEKQDTTRSMLLIQLAAEYLYSKPDTTLLLAQQSLDIAERTNFRKGEAFALNKIANAFINKRTSSFCYRGKQNLFRRKFTLLVQNNEAGISKK